MSSKKAPSSDKKIQKTLLPFFTKKTAPPKAFEDIGNLAHPIKETPKGLPKPEIVEKSPELKEKDAEEDEKLVEPRKKRRRVILSDSEDETREGKVEPMNVDDSDTDFEPEEEKINESDEEKVDKRKSKQSSTRKVPSVFLTPHMKSSTPRIDRSGSFQAKTPRSGLSEHSKSMFTSYTADDSFSTSFVEAGSEPKFKHENLPMLRPDMIRDGEKRKKSDPDYDPRTLYVPPDFMKKQTPGHQQWWSFKAKHFDTILMFKVGKFYELYHMDAEVCVKELNLTYMKGDFAHCGFPEIAYGRFADQLVQRGYKVARIEQVETPSQMEERRKSRGGVGGAKASEKVVQREICRITTPGTVTLSHMDTESGVRSQKATEEDETEADDSKKQAFPKRNPTVQAHSRFLAAFCEKIAHGDISEYGICFVDTSTGSFKLLQFKDDLQRSMLRTLLAHNPPAQVLLERGNAGSHTSGVLDTLLAGNTMKEALTPKSQFLTAQECLKLLIRPEYLGPFTTGTDEASAWPITLQKMVDQNDPLGKTPRKDAELALSALGAVIWYLKQCLIDTDVISMRNFKECTMDACSGEKMPELMVLDGITISNLNIVPCDFTVQGDEKVLKTLYHRLDFCSTPFGKRMLRQWLCSPLCSPQKIMERQEAVKELKSLSGFREIASKLLKTVPDLERLLQKIHTLGSLHRAQHHPESRAVMFEADKYNKRKIMSLQMAVDGFNSVLELISAFQKECPGPKSSLLKSLMTYDPNSFPDIRENLQNMNKSFNREKALKSGVIVPEPGSIKDYDEALEKVEAIARKFDDYLHQQKKELKCKDIEYFGSGKNRYQMEIREDVAAKLTDDYEVTSQRKGFKRFTTVELKGMLEDLQKAEEAKAEVLKDLMRRIFSKFDESYLLWKRAVECVSCVDVLLGFVRYADSCKVPVCLPEFVSPSAEIKPFMKVENGYHPCLLDGTPCGDFIPNDISISPNTGNVMLLTGPNMGGKSTLMRQSALLVIMAQMGMYVPASAMCLTPVDRIFTRIGANDRLLAGESTFYVELSETKLILRDATPNSLIVMDELGRGTGTFDGTAIAYAVLKDLAGRIGARTFFSTHYHSLVSDFKDNPLIDLRHMACMVENESDEDPTEETVTFLYRLAPGPCPKSYGFFAAKLAGIPLEVIRLAHEKSRELPLLQAQLKSLSTNPE